MNIELANARATKIALLTGTMLQAEAELAAGRIPPHRVEAVRVASDAMLSVCRKQAAELVKALAPQK
ncbi:hypothetical protein [Roseicyclus persicicus]|uniref:Uncharacterized protein n=1 Tax=Roseicyclus persicicus TaxID=2650661 RepID=A0A7X6GWH5_9RHOB|nr:hypothetical protein [Roseibacterium persicicum]NKX43593.1 hypothetical protein [Roseibacterium persicicum]